MVTTPESTPWRGRARRRRRLPIGTYSVRMPHQIGRNQWESPTGFRTVSKYQAGYSQREMPSPSRPGFPRPQNHRLESVSRCRASAQAIRNHRLEKRPKTLPRLTGENWQLPVPAMLERFPPRKSGSQPTGRTSWHQGPAPDFPRRRLTHINLPFRFLDRISLIRTLSIIVPANRNVRATKFKAMLS